MSIPPMMSASQQRKKYSIAEVFGEDDEGDDADGMPMDECEEPKEHALHNVPGN
jgi:hypothetical protein